MARILVIEDDRQVRVVMRVALEQAGHELLEADSGIAGLAILAARPVDLVICDIKMREIDGIETIRRLRERWHAMPVLVVSGTLPISVMEAPDTASQLGADRALGKPFKPSQLRSAVAELLAARAPDPTSVED
jgi:CheY-like chemotaxis protein